MCIRDRIYYDAKPLGEMVKLAYENQCQFVCDAVGDRAMAMIIDAYETVIRDHENEDLRFGIDHCQITNDRLLERLKQNRLIAGLELGFVESDSYIAVSYTHLPLFV